MLIKLERVHWTLRWQPSHRHLHSCADAKSTSTLEDGALPTQSWHPQNMQLQKAFLQALKWMLHACRTPSSSEMPLPQRSPVKCHLAGAAPLATVGSCDLVLAHCTPVWRNNQREASQEEGARGAGWLIRGHEAESLPLGLFPNFKRNL